MATHTNLLGYFGKAISRKRKSESNITSFCKKTDRNQKNYDDDVVYVDGMYLNLPFYNARQILFNRQSNVRTCLFFNFYCIGTSSSPFLSKIPVGRPENECSCEQLICMLKQNHE